jgi:hypothetical protein
VSGGGSEKAVVCQGLLSHASVAATGFLYGAEIAFPPLAQRLSATLNGKAPDFQSTSSYTIDQTPTDVL